MIYAFPSGPLDTNAYLIVDETTKKAFVVDPAPHSFPIIQKKIDEESLTLEGVCVTHSHWDHMADATLFLKAYPYLFLYVHKDDVENILHPGSDGIPLGVFVQPLSDERIRFYDTSLGFGNHRWEVLHTPGHSPGSVCLFDPEQKILFSGDTLFSGTYGITHTPYGSKKDMMASLLMLSTLPDEVQVYPGHGETCTLGRQKPWIRAVAGRSLSL